jgi:hypothetical protein
MTVEADSREQSTIVSMGTYALGGCGRIRADNGDTLATRARTNHHASRSTSATRLATTDDVRVPFFLRDAVLFHESAL